MALQWNGDGAKTHVRGEMKKKLTRAAIHLNNSVKKMISDPSPPPSAPGSPPHKDTGRLRSSYSWEIEGSGKELTARVGSNLKYAKFLELGTSKMRPREHLGRALREQTTRIKQILRG